MRDFRCKNCGTWIDTIYTYDTQKQLDCMGNVEAITTAINRKAHCEFCGAEYEIRSLESNGQPYDEVTQTKDPKAKVINVAYHVNKMDLDYIPDEHLGKRVKQELARKFVDYILENNLVTYELSENLMLGTKDFYGFLRLVEPGAEL